jgi:glycosyltransferase involved in cell wall biosynthesis
MIECLEELIKQTIFKNLEILVVDAASPQKEKDIVSSYQKKYDNISYLRLNKRIGIYPAWNIGIKKTTAPYITPFSTNDRLNPVAYETLSKALDENPDIDLVYGDTYLSRLPHTPFEHGIDAPGMVQKWDEYSYKFLLEDNCIGPHPMWRRKIHDTVGYFSEDYVALGDQEFWLRLGRHSKMLHIPFFSGLFWWSKKSLSGQDISHTEFLSIRKKYFQQYLNDYKLMEHSLKSIQNLINLGQKEKAEKLVEECRKQFFYIFENFNI